MAGGMAFRKDCEECGRSFLSPDRKTKLCPRCAGMGSKRSQQRKITTEGHPSKPPATAETSIGKRTPSAPTVHLKPQVPKKIETQEIREKAPDEPQRPEIKEAEIVLTKAQEQEIIERYQSYVQGMERPPKGRRKTIAAEMELPYRAVVLAVRRWKQRQSQEKDFTREERFSVEKAYFSFLERASSFSLLKEQITQETGLSLWEVSRHLDILHDCGEKLQKVPEVSPEQRTTILAEYHKYLSDPVPPSSPLHGLIAERTGVNSKQVHKVLVSYRLDLLRRRWS